MTIFGEDGNLLPKYVQTLNEHLADSRKAMNHSHPPKNPTGIMIECPRCRHIHERCSRKETTVRCKKCGLRIHYEALPQDEQVGRIVNGGVR